MKTSLPSTVLAVVLGCSALTVPAQVATAQESTANAEFDSFHRIEIARRLRLLTEVVPAAACHFTAGIETDTTQFQLEMTVEQMNANLDALEFGNPDMKVSGAETRRKTIAAIQAVRDSWVPMQAAAQGILNGESPDENLLLLANQDITLLGAVEHLVTETTNQYTNPNEVVGADSFLMEIAGRQKVLIEKMSMDACLMYTDHTTDTTAARLQEAISTFDASLGALRNGMPSAGLRPPPNDEVAEGLTEVAGLWQGVKPTLEAIAGGDQLDPETRTAEYVQMSSLFAAMSEVDEAYEEAFD